MGKIMVGVKKVNHPLEFVEIENTLEAMQDIVDGFIEAVPMGDFVIICNEEGRLIGLPYNGRFGGVDFVGDVIVTCANDEGDFVDIRPWCRE